MAKKRANGEGNIRKRKDGRWEGRYTAGYDPETGKRIIKNVLGKTQAEVKQKLAAAQQESEVLDVSRTEEYTVATWLKSWYELYAKPNVRLATADRYRLMIETYTIPRIGRIKLKKLTSRDLQKLYKDLMEHGRVNQRSGHGNPGLSSTTVRSVHLMLHSAFERAVKERLIPRNPTDDCIAPKVQKVEMKTLRREHLKSYLDAADARGVLPMFYLELVSGLRKGELVALLWDDLDIQSKTISVSKQYIKNPSGTLTLSRPKTETSVRRVSIPQEAVCHLAPPPFALTHYTTSWCEWLLNLERVIRTDTYFSSAVNAFSLYTLVQFVVYAGGAQLGRAMALLLFTVPHFLRGSMG